MATIDTMRTALQEVEQDLASLDERRTALELAADGLRQAIAAHGGSSPVKAPAKKKPAKKKAAASSRPRITPDDLVDAVRALGGSAAVDALVEKLGLPDGRSLNGARRVAVDDGRIVYADRTYSLPSNDPRWPEEQDPED